jgi:transcription elongation GreA/GreB family factor
MLELPPKKALVSELLRVLTDELNVLERAQKAAQEAATHEEARPEDDKDTRALEQSYLARGQARRVEELRSSLADVSALPVRDFAEDRPAALGAVVIAEENGKHLAFFIAPNGGGTSLAGGAVQVLTPNAPLGRALIGKHAGEACEVLVAGRTRALDILKVL